MAASNITFNLVAKDKASGTVDKFGQTLDDQKGRLDGVKVAAVAALAAGAAAATAFVGSSMTAASDLSETLNKSSVIFGKQAASMETWAETADRAFGLSKAGALEAAAGFGDMFSQLGFTGGQSADMSKQIVQLSADLGSFNNLGTDEVLDKISGAMRGEYDSLQALIPNINAARVEQEALAASGKTAAKELTAQEKAAAVLAIIQKDGSRAAGDFANTSDGLANSTKSLTAQWENFQATLGQQFLPVAGLVTSWLSGTALPALTAVGDFITNTVVPAVQVFWQALTGGSEVGEFDGIMGRINDAGATLYAWGVQVSDFWTSTLSPALASLGTWLVNNRDWLIAVAIAVGTAVLVWQTYVGVTKAWTAATTAAKAAQTAFNAALKANPIGIIITALTALVAGLVWFFTKTETGRQIWAGFTSFLSSAWQRIKGAFADGWNAVYRYLGQVWDFVKKVWSFSPIGLVVTNWDKILDFFRGIPGKMRTFFSGLSNIITAPFRAGFNAIAGLWNRSVANLSWTAPSWIPGIGGKTIAVPKIPMLATGGILTKPTLFMGGEGGETEVVQPLSKLDRFMRDYVPRDQVVQAATSTGDGTFRLHPDDAAMLVAALADTSRRIARGELDAVGAGARRGRK